MRRMTIGEHPVEISKADKVLFDDDGITKRDLAEYYARVSEIMLPHVRGHPLAMARYPDGIGEEGFFQKEAAEHFPDFVERATLPKEEGGTTTYVVAANAATLVYLADQACITPHTLLAPADSHRRPDRMIFDLDPEDEDFGAVRDAARAVRELLDEAGLGSFLMTSGSRGLHVWVALDGRDDFDTLRAFTRLAGEELSRRHPRLLTVAQRKEQRDAPVFVDTLRNSYGQHAVAPYGVRARSGAPVATPLDWKELGDGKLGPRRYTIRNVRQRLGQKADPWRTLDSSRGSVSAAHRRLVEAAGR